MTTAAPGCRRAGSPRRGADTGMQRVHCGRKRALTAQDGAPRCAAGLRGRARRGRRGGLLINACGVVGGPGLELDDDEVDAGAGGGGGNGGGGNGGGEEGAEEGGEGAAGGFDYDGEDADGPALGGTAGSGSAHAAAARGVNSPAGWRRRRQASGARWHCPRALAQFVQVRK